MRNARIAISALSGVVALAGCGAPGPMPTACPPGTGQAMQIYTLYFGRAAAARAAVSEAEWRDFRDRVVSPALPDGYTVLDAQGAWMNPRLHTTISEATKILVVALPGSQSNLPVINRIRSAWQHRFHQYVVGMTVQSGCGSFLPAEAPP